METKFLSKEEVEEIGTLNWHHLCQKMIAEARRLQILNLVRTCNDLYEIADAAKEFLMADEKALLTKRHNLYHRLRNAGLVNF